MPDLLLIDDNAELRGVLTEAVELYGYSVKIARDAEEGLALLDQGFQPTVIICDVALPRMNGLQFAGEIRKKPQWAEIFFITMSGTVNMRDEALEAGANFYLVKPFSFQELYDILDQKDGHKPA